MKILLINANPVVSRLLALCTRDEDIVLDEVKHIDAIKEIDYDLLFVNDASYEDHIDTLLEKKSIRKKVFISYDEEPVKGFDQTIKKPFLPSQIIEVIESVDMSEMIVDDEDESISISSVSLEEEYVDNEELPPIFPLSTQDSKETDDLLEIVEDSAPEVLNSDEIEKIKALLEMDDEIALTEDEPISDDEYEARKVKIIKEQLIADGLEIIEEDAIVEELSTVVADSSKKASKTKKSKKKKKETAFNKKELSRIEDAVVAALNKMKPKKIEKLLKGKKIEIKIKLEDEQ
ncbi:MAG: hypothetical protein WBM70_04250 [Sulfurovum sp.]|uniref:hypothetical protein n=1 Tax=Sulfurovum sp. TaxID=1969726 RepID=UPI003C759DF7